MIRAIPFGRKFQENPAAICLILLVFAVWHAATYVCDSQEQKGIPGIDQYICGNNISTIDGHKILGRWGKKRHGKMKFFQGLPYNSPVFTKTVITLSFGVSFGPTSTQNAHGERANPEKTPSLHQEARSTLKFSLKQDYLALESQRTSFAAVFRTSFWTHWHFLWKEIREITLIIDISPPGRDKHSFLQMLHDPGNPIWP